jgi:molecular chaperone DnaK
VLDSADAATLRSKTETLAQLSMKLGEAMYRAQAEGGGDGDGGAAGGGSGSAGASDENVVDADFEEVDDDKKKSA